MPMLHQIKLPKYVAILNDFLQVQRQLLDFACKQHLPRDIPKELITDASFPNHLKPWLWGKLQGSGQVSLSKGLHILSDYVFQAIFSEQERQELVDTILDTFDHDIAFFEHIADKDYQFAYPRLHPDLQDALKPLMVYGYDLLTAGFPLASGETFDYHKLAHAFWHENEDTLEVCPYCDGPAPERPKNGNVAADNDHFFPRAQYPMLSVHPYNLIPACIPCNSRFKTTYNPLGRRLLHSLHSIYHPYLRPALYYNGQTLEQEIAVDILSSTPHAYAIRLVPSQSSTDSDTIIRIQNMNRIFNLENRWAGETIMPKAIKSLQNEIYGKIRHSMRMGHIVQINDVIDYLDESVEKAKGELRREQYALLKYGYARSLRASADACEAFLAAVG